MNNKTVKDIKDKIDEICLYCDRMGFGMKCRAESCSKKLTPKMKVELLGEGKPCVKCGGPASIKIDDNWYCKDDTPSSAIIDSFSLNNHNRGRA